MSDDGVMNVEDDGPAVPAVEPVAEVPAVEAAPDVPAEDTEVAQDADQSVAKRAGVLADLIAERKQRQAVEKQLNEVKPYADFLKANPDLLKARQAPPPPAPATFGAPPPDPQSEALAKTLDLYTPEGKPDIARADTIRSMMVQTAQQISAQQMAPVHEQNAQTASARNFQIMLGAKDPQGRSVNPEALAAVWRAVPAHLSADPQVASVLALTAAGMDTMSRKAQPAAPANAPLVTEASGGPGRRPNLSQLESNLARDRGIPEAKWAEHTRGFLPGRANQLED